MLRWNMLDQLWDRMRQLSEQNWYVYAIGETPPKEPMESSQLLKFIDEMNGLLRKDHEEDYCGIVYVDNRDKPEMIKIFDPNNLGASCGSSGLKILPAWVISQIKPTELTNNGIIIPANRKRWWQRLFSR